MSPLPLYIALLSILEPLWSQLHPVYCQICILSTSMQQTPHPTHYTGEGLVQFNVHVAVDHCSPCIEIECSNHYQSTALHCTVLSSLRQVVNQSLVNSQYCTVLYCIVNALRQLSVYLIFTACATLYILNNTFISFITDLSLSLHAVLLLTSRLLQRRVVYQVMILSSLPFYYIHWTRYQTLLCKGRPGECINVCVVECIDEW